MIDRLLFMAGGLVGGFGIAVVTILAAVVLVFSFAFHFVCGVKERIWRKARMDVLMGRDPETQAHRDSLRQTDG